MWQSLNFQEHYVSFLIKKDLGRGCNVAPTIVAFQTKTIMLSAGRKR